MITAVELPRAFERQLRDEARGAFPRECCGLIEGENLILRQAQDEDQRKESLTLSQSKGEATRVFRVTALHPMPNVSEEMDHFEIDPAGHIALLRKLRGSGRAIIGCYHSHPNGRAEPSERDRQSAVEADFLWLICAVGPEFEGTNIAAFVSDGQGFSSLRIEQANGNCAMSAE
ncbi:MAG TPA: M67 family metallopeptidase [Rhizomicrobium sp.]|nr:M67 family metallopeptidase [Rhizomicrobium sp.]